MIRPSLSALCALSLAGCAAEGNFPSLGVRPAEKLSMEEPIREAPVIARDADLARKIADLLAEARQGQSQYEESLPAVRAATSGAGAAGSESWIEAQQALSRLEAARAPTATALAELDALSVRRTNLPINAGDLAALQGAIDAVSMLVRGQQETIDRLLVSLGTP